VDSRKRLDEISYFFATHGEIRNVSLRRLRDFFNTVVEEERAPNGCPRRCGQLLYKCLPLKKPSCLIHLIYNFFPCKPRRKKQFTYSYSVYNEGLSAMIETGGVPYVNYLNLLLLPTLLASTTRRVTTM
jgi:hypothetical protein